MGLSFSDAYSGVYPIVSLKIMFPSHLAPLECKALSLRKDTHAAKPKLIDLERTETVPANLIVVRIDCAKGFCCWL